MSRRKLNYLLLLCLFIATILLWLVIDFRSSKKLKVIFLDVGQGDAILITEGSQQLLIDGGKDGKLLLEKMGKYVPFWDRRIETVVETHPDQDHIGGLIEIFRAYEVGSVIKTKVLGDSQTFKKLEEEIAKQQPNILEAKTGIKLQFPNGEFADVLYPLNTTEGLQKETNASSVVIKLETTKDRMLFMGDLPSEQENELIKNNPDLAVDILKVGHHGSKYSSGNQFLETVKAKYAVISVGRQNSYGHPNQETIQRLLQNKLEILRTDQLGDIVFDCPLQEKCSLVPL